VINNYVEYDQTSIVRSFDQILSPDALFVENHCSPYLNHDIKQLYITNPTHFHREFFRNRLALKRKIFPIVDSYAHLMFQHLVSFSQRSEEHTSELQSRFDLVCRLLLE